MNSVPNGPATYIVAGLTGLVAVVGGIVVVTDPASLNFKEYVETLGLFAGAAGLLSIGRGLFAGSGK